MNTPNRPSCGVKTDNGSSVTGSGPGYAARFHRAGRVAALGDPASLRGSRAHDMLPVDPVAVLDQPGDRTSERLAQPDAADEARGIGLDLHALATTVSRHAPLQIGIDPLEVDGHTCGEPLQDADQHWAVRLAGGEESQCPQGHILPQS